MKEDFVGYDLAVKLKEKGFPQIKKGTLAMYNEEGEWYSLSKTLDDYYYLFEDFDDKDCVCPTIPQLLKWLRNEKKIHMIIDISEKGWFFNLRCLKTGYIMDCTVFGFSDTYEQAALTGVNYCLENLI